MDLKYDFMVSKFDFKFNLYIYTLAVRAWDSPHSCNGREIRWNLRDPVKAVVGLCTLNQVDP
jgi:hypothetical protein